MQGMAGNIIHAIATTNAIVGGLIVIEALKLLANVPEKSKVRASWRLPNLAVGRTPLWKFAAKLHKAGALLAS